MHPAVSEAAERDRDIVELLRTAGRDRAFEQLLRRYEGKVFRLCCALLRDRALAEDVAQESLVRVWKALARYDGRASMSSWIYAITRNRCLTALERRRSFDSIDAWDEDGEPRASTVEVPDDGRADRLLELIGLLPERLRRVLALYYFEDRSVKEVALMLGCPEGTVKTTLFRARAALTEILRRRGLDDPIHWQEGA